MDNEEIMRMWRDKGRNNVKYRQTSRQWPNTKDSRRNNDEDDGEVCRDAEREEVCKKADYDKQCRE